jgi:hypothetical protein
MSDSSDYESVIFGTIKNNNGGITYTYNGLDGELPISTKLYIDGQSIGNIAKAKTERRQVQTSEYKTYIDNERFTTNIKYKPSEVKQVKQSGGKCKSRRNRSKRSRKSRKNRR